MSCWYCAASVTAGSLKEHLAECPVMITRRELAGRAAIGKDVSECLLCGAMIANRAMDRHISKSCPARLVSCRNEGCG